MPIASLQCQGYLPVATATLSTGAVLECDLYLQRPGCEYAELYRAKTYPIDAEDLHKLRQDGIDHLYIRQLEADAFRNYLCEHILHDPSVLPIVRVQALRALTRVAFDDALAASDCNRLVDVARGFSADLVGMVAEQPPVCREVFKAIEHDYYTFTHACNVSTYCTLLALQLEICDSVELAELAAGGLLHDIGKRHIPPHILNKPGKLTEQEWKLMYDHPITGYRDLAFRGDVSGPQLMMVYQHHERLDGSGYPAGTADEDIHPWARICAVADVFDAMTSKRPYRSALSVKQACDYLGKHSPLWFDAKVVNCWLQLIRSPAS